MGKGMKGFGPPEVPKKSATTGKKKTPKPPGIVKKAKRSY